MSSFLYEPCYDKSSPVVRLISNTGLVKHENYNGISNTCNSYLFEYVEYALI